MTFNEFVKNPHKKEIVSYPSVSSSIERTEGGLLLSSEEKESIRLKELRENHEKEVEATRQYNASVTTIDPLYGSLKPLNGVLVRVFTHEVPEIKEGSLLLMNGAKKIVSDTKAGVGTKAVDNDYDKFTRKAFVVASNVNSIPQGSLVQLSPVVITPRYLAAADAFYLEHGFTHWSADDVPPKSYTNPHFGYFLVPPHLVQCLIENQ